MPPGALPPSPELQRAAAKQDSIPQCGSVEIVAGRCLFQVKRGAYLLQLREIQSSKVLDASGDAVRNVPTLGNGLRATLLASFPAAENKPRLYADNPAVTVANGESASGSAELTRGREDSVRQSGSVGSLFYKVKMVKATGSDVADLQWEAGAGCTFTVPGPCDRVCCPVGKADFGTGTCVLAVPDTTSCADGDYIAIDGSCVATCPSGSYVAPDDRNCVAECPGNTFISEDAKTCIVACPNYVSADGKSCLAACPNYIAVNGKDCVAECPADTYIFDGENCVVECPEAAEYISLDGKSCVASCESDEFLDDPQCVASCSDVDKLEYGKECVDECPEGTVVSELNADVCVVPPPVEQVVTPGRPPAGWTCPDEVRDATRGSAGREGPGTDALDARSTGPPTTAATAAAGWWTR